MERSGSRGARQRQRQQQGEDIVRHAVRDYAARFPELSEATERFTSLITRMLDDAGINYLSVTGRTKSVASFAGKAVRQEDGVPLYRDPLREITDQMGVRVITYLATDVAAVAELVSAELTVLDDRDMGRETAAEGQWGYNSRHILVSLDPSAELAPEDEMLRGRSLSLQVRTILQHAWAEFEHDIRYKGHLPEEHAPDLNRRFTLAAGLLELADREFTAIRDRIQETLTDQQSEQDPSDPRIGAKELATFLAGQFADAGWSKTDHYSWISGLLLELGITSLEELSGLLASVDSAAITDRMGYRYPPGAVRRLDDALLAVFGAHYVALHGNDDRRPLLQERLDKLIG
ncbi:GTP pyrophosphokinase [Ornithinicoccus hortensis]|uniref:PpGpp synthetase/RelA/SpoT-type nucleotidyltransferase n=1 Tax=Ornithinicoccus hortensis TaxID=82346 RepID=A0A542YT68_9MICO|nr:GTP pyrophosphokinase [Ornithinicoccus hortensis]TQL51292.1 ppGpp synthetase/RelA/SpoT-type nucleotidyltransferase [Ornithinicoccus hortensis]